MSSILTFIRNHAQTAVIVFSLCLAFTAVSAQDKPLEIRVDSVFGFSGQQNTEIPIYLKNSLDSIIAFQLWFGLEQPDLIQFGENGAPTIVTEGTLTEGWSFAVNSLGEQGYDVYVVGSVPSWIPPYNGYIEAHDTEMPLFKLQANIYNVPDTISDSVVHIHLIDQILDHFTLVDNHGENIGIFTETVTDTAYFRCLEWMPENENICLQWEQVTTAPYDSMSIEDILVARLDTAYVGTEDGSLTVLLCGDIRVDKVINIIDIVDFIDYKFNDGETPEYLENADVNHDGSVNILDILSLIAYKFQGGPAPACY